jgi:hypothetical protein
MTIDENRFDHVGDALLRLDAILAPKGRLPISRSGWWARRQKRPLPKARSPRATHYGMARVRYPPLGSSRHRLTEALGV